MLMIINELSKSSTDPSKCYPADSKQSPFGEPPKSFPQIILMKANDLTQFSITSWGRYPIEIKWFNCLIEFDATKKGAPISGGK